MKRLKTVTVIASIALPLIFSGCSNKKSEIPTKPEPEMYATAQKKLQEGNYQQAIAELEAIDSRYPFGANSARVQLDLIYAYYKANELELAIASIDRFLRLNPTHPDVDYVIYLRGLTNMASENNTLQNLFRVNRNDRDPQHARIAFADFKQLLQSFPNSPYANDSQKRLNFLYNRLAEYELSVVKYYNKREAFVAVINRVENMLTLYPEAKATKDALVFMEKAYQQLNLTGQAAKVQKLLEVNPKK